MAKVYKLSAEQQLAFETLEGKNGVNRVFFGGGAGCFIRDTLVLTVCGHKKIQEIKPKELVISYNVDLKVFEAKMVLNTFVHNADRQTKKFITFEVNNNKFTCTNDHEFYFRGAWNKASIIAERTLDIRSEHEQQIFNIKPWKAVNDRLQRREIGKHNEASIRQKRVFANVNSYKWQNKTNQITSIGSGGMDKKSTEQTTSKPYKLHYIRQQCAKPGMGYCSRKLSTQRSQHEKLQNKWSAKKQTFWGRNRNVIVEGKTGFGNTQKVQPTSIHERNVGEGVQCFTRYDQRHNIEKELGAFVVNTFESNQVCYDFEVEDNHNYLISENNIIAHNSGKSLLGCMWHIYRRTKYPKTRGLISRNEFADMRDSTMKTFFTLLNDWGYRDKIDYSYNAQEKVIAWSNGSETFFRYLKQDPSDPEMTRLGGTEYTDVFIDELPDCSRKAYDIIFSRIRYKLVENGFEQKLLATGNPTDNWVKNEFITQHNEGNMFIQGLLQSNPDTEFVKLYTQGLMRLSEYDRKRLLDGDWDAEMVGANPFAYAFVPENHKVELPLTAEPIIASIDFNLDPFAITWHQIQRKGLMQVYYTFDEHEIRGGSIHAMADYMTEKLNTRQLMTLIVTGDSMGNNRNISQRDNASNYTMLRRMLKLRESQVRVPPNPTHEKSRNDVNGLFFLHENNANHKVFINPICTKLLKDLRLVQCDAEGSIIKANRTYEEQRADYLDTYRYFVNTFAASTVSRMINEKGSLRPQRSAVNPNIILNLRNEIQNLTP